MAQQWLSEYHKFQLLICLEMAREVGNERTNPRGPLGVELTRSSIVR
jgi:hypothetical protein